MLIALLCFLLVLSDVTKYSTEKLGSAVDSTRAHGQFLRVLEIRIFLLSFKIGLLTFSRYLFPGSMGSG